MKVRTRLTFLFTGLIGFLLFIIFLFIYFDSERYRRLEFQSRLQEKAISSTRIMLEVDEVDSLLLSQMVDKKKIGTLIQERVQIIDETGKQIYSTDPDNYLQADSKKMADILDNYRLFYKVNEIEVAGLLFPYNGKRYYVFAGALDFFGNRKVKNLRNTLIILWLLSVVVFAAVGWVFASRAMRPINEMVHQVDAIQVSNMKNRLQTPNTTDELGRLATTFNRLLTRVEKAVLLEQNFVSNASHELRNPLTAAISQLEVSLLQERSNDEYSKTIKSVLEDLRDMKDVANRLLILAQVNEGTAETSFQTASIDQIILLSIEEIIKTNPSAHIDIDFPEASTECKINVNELLIRHAFQNLIENGCKFSENQITVKLITDRKKVTVQFIDSGIGIPQDELPKIYDSFFRAKNTHSIKGHGIGLSLVKKILDTHSATIEVNSTLGKGTTVTVVFQRAY